MNIENLIALCEHIWQDQTPRGLIAFKLKEADADDVCEFLVNYSPGKHLTLYRTEAEIIQYLSTIPNSRLIAYRDEEGHLAIPDLNRLLEEENLDY